MYEIGNWIVHTRYGIGQIKGREEKEIGGQKNEYINVKTVDGEYWIPYSNSDVDYIRPVATENQVKYALSLIRKPHEHLEDDHKKREAQIKERSEDSSLSGKAKLMRDLNARKYEQKLNMREQQILNKLVKQFVNEWQVINGEESNLLESRLSEVLEISVEKLIKK